MNYSLPLSDGIQLLWILHQYGHPHLHLGLHQSKVQAGNLWCCYLLYHSLGGNCAVQGIAVDEHGFPGALAMGFENIDGFDWVPGINNMDQRTNSKIEVGSFT